MKAKLVALALLCGVAAQAKGPPADILLGTRVFPESMTADTKGNLYTGSNAGTIYRVRAGAKAAEPWIRPDATNGIRSLFGVFADDKAGVLWACAIPNLFATPRESGASALKAFDLATGRFKASYPLPTDKPAACNDIAVARDGTVYATETLSGRLFVLRPHATALEKFADSPDLVGVDGIAIAGDGTIYINNVRKQLFQRVNLAADGSYAALTNLTLSMPLNGPDGLRTLGGNRFLQGEGPGGRVAVITVSGDSATVTPVKTGLDGSVGVARAGPVGYAIEGRIGYLIDPKLKDQDPGPFMIRAFPIPR
jgi:sugar lactone lactonase YvrE